MSLDNVIIGLAILVLSGIIAFSGLIIKLTDKWLSSRFHSVDQIFAAASMLLIMILGVYYFERDDLALMALARFVYWCIVAVLVIINPLTIMFGDYVEKMEKEKS